MKNFGFVKMSRKFMTSEMWEENRVFSKAEAWIDLLFMAAHDETTNIVAGFEVPLRRGELVASDSYLMRRWRWSRNKVRLFLKTLELQERIDCLDHETANQAGRIVFILNYDHYQQEGFTGGPRV